MDLLQKFLSAGRAVSAGSSHRVPAYVLPAQRSTSWAFLQVNKYSVWTAANPLSLWPRGRLKRMHAGLTSPQSCIKTPAHPNRTTQTGTH